MEQLKEDVQLGVKIVDKQTGQIIDEWKLEENDWNWQKIKRENYYNRQSKR